MARKKSSPTKTTAKKGESKSSDAKKTGANGGDLGFEAQLWKAADALRSNMDAAEYKHVVLGLIFLKYISDAFEEQHAKLQAEKSQGADPEDPDEYRAQNIFWVPPEARWSYLRGRAKDPKIGKIVDDAMLAIERDNPSLKGVLPKDYAGLFSLWDVGILEFWSARKNSIRCSKNHVHCHLLPRQRAASLGQIAPVV